LARDDGRYKQLLIAADRPRDGDRDGRGNLSQSGLNLFAQFFLDRARDQVSFMGELLDPAVLLRRVELYVEDEIAMKKMPRGSLAVLREVLLNGEIERGRVPSITGYEERAARMITSSLVDRGMLVSTSSRAPLRLGLPADVAERWFPRLYPIGAGGVE
jgi:hypothetical protein